MERFACRAVLVFALFFLGTNLYAQATRTWVSAHGDDVNPCSRTAPCKTFAGAISRTIAGGEIDVMDPGAFGALTITKSLTIDGGGFIAGVLSTNGSNGIVINAGPNDVVTLRRLQINGAGTGNNGVRILGAKHVNIEDTEIIGFSANGVDVQPAAASTVVHITDSRINNHGNAGVRVVAGNVMVASSSLVGNTYAGVDASSSLSLVLVSGSTLSMNGRGLRASTNAMIRMTHNDIVFNTTYAWENAGGTIETHVDNRVRGTTVGALTTVSYP